MRWVLVLEDVRPAQHKWLHNKRAEEADNLVKHVFNLCKTSGYQGNLRSTTWHYCGNVIRRLMFNKRYFGKGRQDRGPTIDEEQHGQNDQMRMTSRGRYTSLRPGLGEIIALRLRLLLLLLITGLLPEATTQSF
ncbi:hypothetical protein NL676_019686 [Syzygium grande]|nr:hypothetical protein NL676_019686 [Syzygium grande]